MLKTILVSAIYLFLIAFTNSTIPTNANLENTELVNLTELNNSASQPLKCGNSKNLDLVFQALILPDLGVYCTFECQEGYCCVIAPMNE